MSKMAADPETQRWWALMFPMLEKLPPDIPGQRWTDLTEIFHFEGSSAFEEGRVAAHEDSQT
jgi:L-rhamnose mutarotase